MHFLSLSSISITQNFKIPIYEISAYASLSSAAYDMYRDEIQQLFSQGKEFFRAVNGFMKIPSYLARRGRKVGDDQLVEKIG
jgi:hypothetical protein